MVMHARKQPRLDDGYMDKRDPHPFQSKYPSKTYGDRSSRREDSGHRDDSPSSRNSPRYINKKSFVEKDKSRHDRGPYISPDKKINHASTSSSSRGGSGQNGSNDKGKVNHRDHKQEVQKPALRTCGDWSEHISSSGKQYYYNSKTGLSQWEKPDEWNDFKPRNDRGKERNYEKDGRNRCIGDGTHSSSDRTARRQGSLEFNPSLHNEKPDKHFLIQKFQDSQRLAQMESRAKQSSKSSDSRYHRETGTLIDHSGTNSTNRTRRDSDRTSNRKHGAQMDDMDISPESSPASSRPSSCAGTPNLAPASTPLSITTPNSSGIVPGSTSTPFISQLPQLITQLSGGQNNQELTNKALQTLQKLQEVISLQIAQQTTRASTSLHQQVTQSTDCKMNQPSMTRSSHQSVSTATQQSYTHVNHHPQSNQQIPISNPHVTSNHVGHIHSPGTVYTPSSGATVYGRLGQVQQQHVGHQSPYHQLHVETNNSHVSQGGQSPKSEHGHKSSCASPSSTTSSQDLPVGELPTAGLNQTDTPSVSSSLSQYYNDKLIKHVTGWQGDQAERQAQRYWEEGISVGSFHCGQVGVELKKARSLVRLAEIQSTLHEQRILFLSTQVHELESMKAPTFTSSN